MPGLRPSKSSLPTARASGRRALGGILVRKERWGLSWQGRILMLLALAVLIFIALVKIHSFLSVTSRAQGDYLVVEGWIHYPCFEQAAAEFRHGNYRKLITSGVRRDSSSKYGTNDTYAHYAAEQLKDFGLTDNLLQAVPCRVERKDRTYNSALAVKKWFADNGIKIKSLDVVTEGAHARRTRLLYQKAFGTEIKIGIIALKNPSYDMDHWWRSSEGVREVIGETVAYIYAKFFFSFCRGTEADAGGESPRIPSHTSACIRPSEQRAGIPAINDALRLA